MRDVVNWLLEEDQPSVRYHALVDLLGRSDGEVKQARSEITNRGWARDILDLQKPKGYFEKEANLYRPKYTATNWRAIVLADLGLTRKVKRIKRIANLFFKYWLALPSGENVFNDEVCIVGNTARTLTNFGYFDDFKVKKLFDRLVEDQKEDGGWHCFQSDSGTLDGWEGLAAFAALPRAQHTRSMRNSIERGAEFYLERRLFEEGKHRYSPWFRFHYPNHYYYDILVGLEVLTKLGYGADKRLEPALKILKGKRQSDGTWLLDEVHPDIGPGANYHMRRSVKKFALEEPQKPSKWITLTALKILKRVDEAS
jgi:hypothetical protein